MNARGYNRLGVIGIVALLVQATGAWPMEQRIADH